MHYIRCLNTHVKTSDTVTLEDESRIKRTEGEKKKKSITLSNYRGAEKQF